MRYGTSNGWLDNQPAAITRKVGRGTITYIGAWMDATGMKRAAQWMLATSGVKPDLPPVPDGVEVYRRAGMGREVFIVENFSHRTQTILLPKVMKDVFAGGVVRSVKLPVYGVVVLTDRK
jgi:beta-galactosidase